jgi:hypothetical protein
VTTLAAPAINPKRRRRKEVKVNLKTVSRVFRKGARIGAGMPSAVSSMSLHVVEGNKWTRVGTIDRDDFVDLTAKQLKHKITKMRERGESINPRHREWMIETHFHGNVWDSCKLSVD